MAEDIHWQKYATRFKTLPALLADDGIAPGLAVCIPVYAEPELISTMDSLWSCELPGTLVDVFILFNMSNRMTADEIALHKMAWRDCRQWVSAHQKQGLRFRLVNLEVLPDPKGGVGWARKLVLDEAARKLDQHGILLCLDGDCIVEPNYLRVVYDYFQSHPSCDAASLNFEHRLELLGEGEKEAITQYELHLRYLVQAMRWTGHPFAYHTIGSAMAVRRNAYLLQGGMNTRQAGEDFYFLQKFIEIGNLHEITGTTVFPSARISNRVPFGTGRAMTQLQTETPIWKTTSPEAFSHVRNLFEALDIIRDLSLNASLDKLKQIPEIIPGISGQLSLYLQSIDFYTECRKIASQTASLANFRKRFFRYFNAFRMIRYTHYMRDHFFPDIPVIDAASELIILLNGKYQADKTAASLLHHYRSLDSTELKEVDFG